MEKWFIAVWRRKKKPVSERECKRREKKKWKVRKIYEVSLLSFHFNWEVIGGNKTPEKKRLFASQHLEHLEARNDDEEEGRGGLKQNAIVKSLTFVTRRWLFAKIYNWRTEVEDLQMKLLIRDFFQNTRVSFYFSFFRFQFISIAFSKVSREVWKRCCNENNSESARYFKWNFLKILKENYEL